MDYLVTFVYDPGSPVHYYIMDAPSTRDAENAALRYIGYNPGVDIAVKRVNGASIREITSAYIVVRYKPLTPEEQAAIRFND
jgi:hypothetical protein